MKTDEVLTDVRFPVWNSRSGFAVREFPRRHGDFAIAGALVAMQLDEQARVSRRAIGMLGLGSAARRANAAEESIIGNSVNELVAGDIGSTTYRPTCRGPRGWTQAVQEAVAGSSKA